MKKRLVFYLLALFVMAGFSGVYAQNSKPTKVSKAIKFNVTKPLRDIKPIPPGMVERDWKNKQVPNKFGLKEKYKNQIPMDGSQDAALQLQNGGSREPGTIYENFPGVGNLSGVAPPDTQGDVGPDHYFQVVNSSFAIWDKQGTMVYGPADIITLWDGFPGPWSSTNDGDPVVVYDEYAQRWVATQFALPYTNGPWYELVAVSQTSDPTGAWNQYAFEFDYFNDYPKFGVWNDGYYMTCHKFLGSFAGAGLVVFEKDKMIAGDPDAQMVEFHVGSGFYGVLAGDADGPTPPPADSPNYLLDVISNAVRIWEADVDWTDPENNSALTVKQTISVPSFSNNNINITQPGTGQKLDALQSMTMYRLQYRNFGDHETLLANHTVNVGSGRAGIRWYEFRKEDGVWSVYQQGTYAPDDGDSRWMGSIAMNNNGDIALGYSVSSSSTYPSIRFAGQTSGAPGGLGVLDIQETSIKEGSHSQTGVSRWGDYSCMTVDPNDGETFWYTTEYSNGGWNWKTQIASFAFVQVPTADFTSDEILIPVGETVNFFDQTSGIPSEWSWSFEGGSPSTSSDQNPENIMFDTEGSFAVTLTATNILGTDTETKEAYITTSSTILPEVNFGSDKVEFCVGDTIHFSDSTIYSPNQWEWTFTPSDVTFVNGTDATSENPEVVFNASGSIDVKLKAWNLNGSSELEKPAMLVAGGILPYYKETFEGGAYSALGWTIENPDGDVTWQLYEIGGTAPGMMASGIDFRDYFAIGERDRMISPAFNLEGYSSAALGFQHSYAQRMAEAADSLIIMVSPDCGKTWSRIFADAEDGSGNLATHEMTDDDNYWPNEQEDWCFAGWGASCIDLDLTPWAGQPNVKVAFETYSFYGNPMMIDNVTISQYLGAEEVSLSKEDIRIYPNPATNRLTVVLPTNSYNEVAIFNQLGQVVKRVKVENSNVMQINLGEDVKAGLYFVKAIGNGTENIQKLIVQ